MKIVAILLLPIVTAQAQAGSLLHYFKEGKTEGQVRNYFMATDNHSLKDYYANATGGSVRYATKRYKGIEFVISGNFTHRTFGAGFNAKDAVTGRPSKWERELFDLAEPDNQGPAGRIGELNVRYRHRNSYITLGRISPGYHPLINKSDGRMQGFAFEGIYSHIAVDSATTIKVSVLTGVSPRSYYQWYSLTEAIGLLSNGYQPDGTAADYKGSINANAVAYIGIEKKKALSPLIYGTPIYKACPIQFGQKEIIKVKGLPPVSSILTRCLIRDSRGCPIPHSMSGRGKMDR
jgi:hypothetical protein